MANVPAFFKRWIDHGSVIDWVCIGFFTVLTTTGVFIYLWQWKARNYSLPIAIFPALLIGVAPATAYLRLWRPSIVDREDLRISAVHLAVSIILVMFGVHGAGLSGEGGGKWTFSLNYVSGPGLAIAYILLGSTARILVYWLSGLAKFSR